MTLSLDILVPPEVRAHALHGLGIVQSDQAEELDGSGKSNRKAPGQGTHTSLAAGPHSTSTSHTVNISYIRYSLDIGL